MKIQTTETKATKVVKGNATVVKSETVKKDSASHTILATSVHESKSGKYLRVGQPDAKGNDIFGELYFDKEKFSGAVEKAASIEITVTFK